MMNRKGHGNVETIVGLIVFFIILVVFLQANIFSEIIRAFSDPALGGLGPLIGVLFVFMIIFAFLQRILGK
jgi:divalent metal cation (Fe/Co/Zn/Cd) transporter